MDAACLIHLMEGRLDTPPHVPSKLLSRTTEGGGLAEEDEPIGDASLHGRRIAALGGRRPLNGAVYHWAGLDGIRTAEEEPDPQAQGNRKGHSSPDAQNEEYVCW